MLVAASGRRGPERGRTRRWKGAPTSGARSIVRAAVALRALRRLRSTPPSARSRALERDVGGPTRRHRCTTSGACHGLRVTPSWAPLRADLGPLEPRPRRRPHHAVHGEEMVIFDGMAGPVSRLFPACIFSVKRIRIMYISGIIPVHRTHNTTNNRAVSLISIQDALARSVRRSEVHSLAFASPLLAERSTYAPLGEER